ncbi:predicted protein [Paecilomyces variotii No. 5]|uniref:X-Pro dipeptidyl-peptidase n=1 Tax=Byssochlamys spectabilis (strain No. 5 / NBRC 109023) TaxID=1356009 RepID=V5FCL4_BYSSN|nr:predicted protein [Paecilomyces variotii No. 5]
MVTLKGCVDECYGQREMARASETLQLQIQRICEDLKDIKEFYNIDLSKERRLRLRTYYEDELNVLKGIRFDSCGQQEKVDYLLLKNYLERDRQNMRPMDAKTAAQDVHRVSQRVSDVKRKVQCSQIAIDRPSTFRAANTLDKLRSNLLEWYNFYNGYDPLFSWWLAEPYKELDHDLRQLTEEIRYKLVGIRPSDRDAIVGQPIGRSGLIADLEAEKIPYSPEEVIWIGESEYDWCETEMQKVSRELGFDNDWHKALEYVKNQYVEPGRQPELVRDLAIEAIEYVQKHDMVTVPGISAKTWRMFMMSPERQKVNPFFLGGETIQVSYPTNTMDHEAKLMSMRGNNIHFARSTVFHELIPGHHLQLFTNARSRSYRRIFTTPFSIEGWALYWEMILWDDERFSKTPENRIGILFWRMHRIPLGTLDIVGILDLRLRINFDLVYVQAKYTVSVGEQIQCPSDSARILDQVD